jgi:hypothetical protein
LVTSDSPLKKSATQGCQLQFGFPIQEGRYKKEKYKAGDD